MLGQAEILSPNFNDGAGMALVNIELSTLNLLTIIIIQLVQNVHKKFCTIYDNETFLNEIITGYQVSIYRLR